MEKSNTKDERDPALVARARRAFERSTQNSHTGEVGTIDRELLGRIERAVGALPRATREIFLAHRLDDYSYIQIANITGLSVGQVERHMAKAIEQIARIASGDERTAWQRWRDAHLSHWHS